MKALVQNTIIAATFAVAATGSITTASANSEGPFEINGQNVFEIKRDLQDKETRKMNAEKATKKDATTKPTTTSSKVRQHGLYDAFKSA